MILPHYRSAVPGSRHNSPPNCMAHAASTDFKVLRRAPQLAGDPEFVVCAGNNSVALFFDEEVANAYCLWRNLH